MDALRGGFEGLVNVNPGHWCAMGIGIAPPDGMIEDEHLGAARDIIQNQLVDLGVIILLDRVIVHEVLLGRRRQVGDNFKSIGVERVFGFVAPDVLDGDLDVEVAEVALGLAGGLGFDEVEGGGTVFGRAEVVESDDCVAAGYIGGVYRGGLMCSVRPS